MYYMGHGHKSARQVSLAGRWFGELAEWLIASAFKADEPNGWALIKTPH